MTQQAYRTFSAVSEDGWSVAASSGSVSNFDVVPDPTAPRSPSGVGRIKFPQGFVAGGEPVVVYKSLNQTSKRYWSFYFKLSSVWEGQSASGCKIHHLYVNGLNRLIIHALGSGLTDPIIPVMEFQQLAANYDAASQGGLGTGNTGAMLPNQPGQTGVQLVRGQWYLMEGYVEAGTPGNADGVVKWWINGVLVGSYTKVPFVAAGGSATWEDWNWAPTWGGLGGTVGQTQYQYIDELYVSGSN